MLGGVGEREEREKKGRKEERLQISKETPSQSIKGANAYLLESMCLEVSPS